MEKIKVLIPTDFTVQAEYAYILVNNLSQTSPMEIHFLHVMNFPDTVTIDLNGTVSTSGEIDKAYVESQVEIAKRKLNQLRNLYGEDKFVHLKIGKTNQTIIDFAESNQFDLIAMGTKGAWGLKEKLSGTETQLVARKSNVPVLSLMCDRSNLELKNILLVHQFEEEINQDLTLLKKIIADFNPKIHFLQIAKNKSEELIKSEMQKFASQHQLPEYEAHILQDKDVESGVIHFNQMNNMDIVCMGTHGKGGFFHSSATEKLINHMFKPIISFQIK
jgi:nucleotide-binding universal stress UspA family protein